MLHQHIKRTIKHTIIYGLGNALSPIIGLLITPIFTRYLTPGDYGVIALLTIGGNLLVGMMDMGLMSASTRFYFDHDSKPQQDRALFTGYITSFVISVSIIGALLLGNSLFTERFFNNTEYPAYISIYLGVAFLININKIPYKLYNILEKSKTFSIIQLSQVVLQVALSFILITQFNHKVLGLLIPSLVGQAFIAVVAHYHFFAHIKFKKVTKKLIKPMLKYGMPLVLLLVSNWVIDLSDRLVLERFSDLNTVGIYNMGYTFALAITLITGAFGTAWSVIGLSITRQQNASEIYTRFITYYAFAISIPALLLCFFVKDFFTLLHPSFKNGAIITPIIVFAYAVRGIYLILLGGIMVTKKTKYQLIIEIPPMILNVLLMFWWIPKYGMVGAAWSTLIAFALMPIITYMVNLKIYPIALEKMRLIKILITTLVLLKVNAYLPIEISFFTIFSKLSIILIGFPLILYLLNFYSKEEKEFIREKIFSAVSPHP